MLKNSLIFNFKTANAFTYSSQNKKKNKKKNYIKKKVIKTNRFSAFRILPYKFFYISKLKLPNLKIKRNFKSHYFFLRSFLYNKNKSNSTLNDIFHKNKLISDKSLIIHSGWTIFSLSNFNFYNLFSHKLLQAKRLNQFKTTNPMFFNNTTFNNFLIFTKNNFLINFFLTFSNITFFKDNFFLTSHFFFFNFFQKSSLGGNDYLPSSLVSQKNLKSILFYDVNRFKSKSTLKRVSKFKKWNANSRRFVSKPLVNLIYYFSNHCFRFNAAASAKKKDLMAYSCSDFHATLSNAYTESVSLNVGIRVPGPNSLLKIFIKKTQKTQILINIVDRFNYYIKKKKNSKFFPLDYGIGFGFFLGKSDSALSKYSTAHAPQNLHLRLKQFKFLKKKKSVFKKKKIAISPALSIFMRFFFFNSFLYSSKLFKKKKKFNFFKKKKKFNFFKLTSNTKNNFSPSNLIFKNKLKQKNYIKSSKNFTFNVRMYSLLSSKEIFFFLFSKPFFFKFFIWNIKNITRKNFLLSDHASLYFDNLYKSFFSQNINKNFKNSNVLPQTSCFLFRFKRIVNRDFAVQSFEPNFTIYHYTNIISFLEYCSGKKAVLNINSFLMTYLDFDERATCALWTPRIKVFRKMLGPRLFLNESLTILYICIKLRDPYLLSAWMLSMFYKISFWKYKLLFRYLYYVLKYFMWPSFANKCIKGLRFQLKGKVSVAGNARTRIVSTSIGATGNGNLNKRVLTHLNLLRTFTGVIGFRTWLSF